MPQAARSHRAVPPVALVLIAAALLPECSRSYEDVAGEAIANQFVAA